MPLAEVEVFVGVAFGSGVTAKLDSVVVGGVDTSGPPTFGVCSGLVVLVDVASEGGRASCDEIMAGSTGAPLTVAFPEGALLAGGVYLSARPVTDSGGNSCL